MTTIEMTSYDEIELRRLVHTLIERFPPAGYGTSASWSRTSDGRYKVVVKWGSAD